LASIGLIQYVVGLDLRSLNSSRPNNLEITATGVKSPKKIMPNTIGLTTLPNACPNKNHALFKGVRRDQSSKLAAKKNKLMREKEITAIE